MYKGKAVSLIISLVLAYATAFVGTLFTAPAIDSWYATLTKPELNPPNWVFGPVWTILYALMAVAAWRVYEKRTSVHVRAVLSLYGAHLVLNALWSIVFFGMQNPPLALAVILALLAAICALTVMFFRIDRVAAYLMLPYIAWVSFATYLNVSIVMLN